METLDWRVVGVVGRITLNRPRALNALTLEMIQGIGAALDRFEHDPAVRLVLIDGAGRGLCAGGDVRLMHDAVSRGDLDFVDALFAAEYRLNARIAHYPKPYVAFMDGIVMGGGIGVSAHGSHRVVTEHSRLAMPETGIGLMPDIGATWMLGRVPGHLGLHVALTGERFGAADAMLLGLADYCIPSANLPDLADQLAAGAPLDATLHAAAIPPQPGALAANRVWIALAYAALTLPEALDTLRARPEPAARAAAELIASRSPTMLRVTRRAFTEHAGIGLEQALEQEFTINRHCLRGPEFREGVRAAVLDKDHTPHWHPANLEDVTPEAVTAFFEPATLPPMPLF